MIAYLKEQSDTGISIEACEKMIAASLPDGAMPQCFLSDERVRRASFIDEFGVGARVLIEFQNLAFQALETWKWAVVAIPNEGFCR